MVENPYKGHPRSARLPCLAPVEAGADAVSPGSSLAQASGRLGLLLLPPTPVSFSVLAHSGGWSLVVTRATQWGASKPGQLERQGAESS